MDPFMGSGSTAIAALKTNRKFIGYEINEKYFQISQKRIFENKQNL
ncbi:MAG: DNA methyltransferase [Paludibacter sp.]